MTAAKDLPSTDISAALLMAPNNIVTFCSTGSASYVAWKQTVQEIMSFKNKEQSTLSINF